MSFRQGFRLGVSTILAVLPSVAWVWWVSAYLLPEFFVLIIGVLSWNAIRGAISDPPDMGGIPLRVFLDLCLMVVGLALYREIRIRAESGNVFGAVLTLGITAPVLLLLVLAIRSHILGKYGR